MTKHGLWAARSGVSAVEYTLAIALVAVLALGAWQVLGTAVDTEVRCVAGALAGGGDCATGDGPVAVTNASGNPSGEWDPHPPPGADSGELEWDPHPPPEPEPGELWADGLEVFRIADGITDAAEQGRVLEHDSEDRSGNFQGEDYTEVTTVTGSLEEEGDRPDYTATWYRNDDGDVVGFEATVTLEDGGRLTYDLSTDHDMDGVDVDPVEGDSYRLTFAPYDDPGIMQFPEIPDAPRGGCGLNPLCHVWRGLSGAGAAVRDFFVGTAQTLATVQLAGAEGLTGLHNLVTGDVGMRFGDPVADNWGEAMLLEGNANRALREAFTPAAIINHYEQQWDRFLHGDTYDRSYVVTSLLPDIAGTVAGGLSIFRWLRHLDIDIPGASTLAHIDDATPDIGVLPRGAGVADLGAITDTARMRAAGLVDVAGTGTTREAAFLQQQLSRLPTEVIDRLDESGWRFQVGRNDVTDLRPELAGNHPTGWPEGTTYADVGMLSNAESRRILVAVEEVDGELRFAGGASADDVFHEAGHALMESLPQSSRNAFEAAYEASIENGRFVAGRDSYYMQSHGDGAEEAFAESFSRYVSEPERLLAEWPELYAYWASNPAGVFTRAPLTATQAATAITEMRAGGGHATRHLVQEGVLPSTGSLSTRIDRFREIATPILTSPEIPPVEWRVGVTNGTAYVGRAPDGRYMAVVVAEEGPQRGHVISSFVLTEEKLAIMADRADVPSPLARTTSTDLVPAPSQEIVPYVPPGDDLARYEPPRQDGWDPPGEGTEPSFPQILVPNHTIERVSSTLGYRTEIAVSPDGIPRMVTDRNTRTITLYTRADGGVPDTAQFRADTLRAFAQALDTPNPRYTGANLWRYEPSRGELFNGAWVAEYAHYPSPPTRTQAFQDSFVSFYTSNETRAQLQRAHPDLYRYWDELAEQDALLTRPDR